MVEHVRILKCDCVIAYAFWAKGKQFRPVHLLLLGHTALSNCGLDYLSNVCIPRIDWGICKVLLVMVKQWMRALLWI